MIEIKKNARVGLTLLAGIILFTSSCNQQSDTAVQEEKTVEKSKSALEGTWKMTYAEIRENDSIQVKDLSATDFIKIINGSHFAFFNQERDSQENFTAGAGTYTYDGSKYVENLNYINFIYCNKTSRNMK